MWVGGCGGLQWLWWVTCDYGRTCRKSLVTRFNATAGGTCEGARIEDTPEEGTEEVSAAVRLLLLRVPVTAVAYKGWKLGIQQVRT